MATGNRFSVKKRRAIAALLEAKNVTEAAGKCGVPVRTLYNWLAEPDFQGELRQAEGGLIDQATRRLLYLSEPALQVLTWAMADESNPPGVRLRAAQAVLDQLLKLRELRNVEERLTALESEVFSNAPEKRTSKN